MAENQAAQQDIAAEERRLDRENLERVMDGNNDNLRGIWSQVTRSNLRRIPPKIVGVDPFCFEWSRGPDNKERCETNIEIFTEKIGDSLINSQCDEDLKVKELIRWTRGNARTWLQAFPQNGSVDCASILRRMMYRY